jgi:hypothetical protein
MERDTRVDFANLFSVARAGKVPDRLLKIRRGGGITATVPNSITMVDILGFGRQKPSSPEAYCAIATELI